MTLEIWAWLALVAYSLHILEEYSLDWRNWAREVLGLPVEWSDFYVTNAVVIVLGIAQANLAYLLPVASLAFAALMLVNATFFHVVPILAAQGRFSPGTFTAVLLFYPVGIGMYRAAAAQGLLNGSTLFLSVAGGIVLMAFPIILLRLRELPYFRQTP
jgi:hypothetical protein